MILDRTWIASRIPHQGDMCLLDRVDFWNDTDIVCRTNRHRLPDNPLRTGGSLGIANGIEFAAQAMAVHGALLAGSAETPDAGFLTSVRDVQWHRARLDDIEIELTIRAQRLSGNELNILYSFSIYAGDTALLSGRASVMIDADKK